MCTSVTIKPPPPPHQELQECGGRCLQSVTIKLPPPPPPPPHQELQECGGRCLQSVTIKLPPPHQELQECGGRCLQSVTIMPPTRSYKSVGGGVYRLLPLSPPPGATRVWGEVCIVCYHLAPHQELQECGGRCAQSVTIMPPTRSCKSVGGGVYSLLPFSPPPGATRVWGEVCTVCYHLAPHQELQECGGRCA